MKDTINQLAQRILSFDFYYEMSDSPNTYETGRRNEQDIKEQLQQLSNDELIQIKEMVSDNMDMVNRYFAPFFNDLQETKEVNTKSEIFKTAWAYFRSELVSTIGEALKMAWKRFKILTALRKGIAYFTYAKATSEERKAIGTLRNGNFFYETKTNKKDTKLDVVKYYDIEKRQFRSFRIERLVSIAA